MGSVISKFKKYRPNLESVETQCPPSAGQKRKNECFEDCSVTLKKRRLDSTIKFIHQTLFVEGKESDITVTALGRSWNLHKIYLQQSPYFLSMFSGNWSESGQSEIHIEISDENIDEESLDIVFGACYSCELAFETNRVIGVLAASSLFQMDELIDQCTDMMIENLNGQCIIPYYYVAFRYGIQKVQEEVILWLANNLITYLSNNLDLLSNIPPELMDKVMCHPQLSVIQSEIFLYMVLRVWAYVRSDPLWFHVADACTSCENFFRMHKRENSLSFVEREEGMEFAKSFSKLRTHNLLEHIGDTKMLWVDNILPKQQIYSSLWLLWGSFLKVLSSRDFGPDDVSDEVFFANSVRLGRIIDSDAPESWRWNTFNYGIELIWTVKHHMVYVQRIRGGLVETRNAHPDRKMIACVSVIKLNEKRQVDKKLVEKKTVTLLRNQEVRLFDFSKVNLGYPIYLNVNLLLVTPEVF